MIESLIWGAAGLIVGVVYHAKLQPYVARGWAWLQAKFGGIRPNPDGEG